MILSIGEILADVIVGENNSSLQMEAHLGGAPLNVAVNAARAGADVAFTGRVGRDVIGKFLIRQAKKTGLAKLDIQTDQKRNTTLAFVTITDGERDFSFFRTDTADYHIDGDKINLGDYENLNIVHLGSLMLSEKIGREFARDTLEKIRGANKLFSFDVNFRSDLYESADDAIKAYSPFVEQADILKFSDDEIALFTGANDVNEAARLLYKPDRLLIVTKGSRGSAYYYNNLCGVIPTNPVKPVDTTGAGDAFFGTVLAFLDGKQFTEKNIREALVAGNKSGAEATLFKGALKL